MTPITTQTLENALTAKLMVSFGKTAAEATDGEMMRASALVLRDMMALREVETRQKARQQHARQVHYLSLEFLMGRSLMKNAYNLGLLPQLREALEHLGFKAADIFEIEPDAALGNGGPGPPGRLLSRLHDYAGDPGHRLFHLLRAGHLQAEDRGGPAGRAAGQLEGPGRGLADAKARGDPGGPLRRHRAGVLGQRPPAHRQ